MEKRLKITLYVLCGIAIVIIIALLCTTEKGMRNNPFTREGFSGIILGIMLCVVITLLSYAGVKPPLRQKTVKKGKVERNN